MYKNSTCQKLRFPLKYGRMVLNDSNTAFFKVGTSKPTIDNKTVLMGSQKRHPKNIY